jgi:hypothetical protein
VPTAAVDAMAAVVRELAPVLKNAGFRKRRHTFDRRLQAGMTHVVDFQMGRFDPPGTPELPPIRLNLYGRFTVNLGVFVPEMVLGRELGPEEWVPEPECQLRMRLGHLLPSGQDTWWSLDDPPEAVRTVGSALSSFGLPWLDGLASRDALIDAYRDLGATPWE